MIDFIIVGQGLAANVLAHHFHQNSIRFKMIGNTKLSNCSNVAAGIWNPIVFKRLTKSWMADELISELNIFYSACEKTLNASLITQRQIIKPFVEVQEKNLWLKKSEQNLGAFLNPFINDSHHLDFKNCYLNDYYGLVENSGNLDLVSFIKKSDQFFKEDIISQTFDYSNLKIEEDGIIYKTIKAKHIIFCEGHLVKHNPFFNWIPLKPAKGEIITIQTNELNFKNKILNKNGFIMDVADQTYKVGATYAWDDSSDQPTNKGLLELKEKLKKIIGCNYQLINHQAGVRPSSADRRPIIGQHPKYKNLHVFNGLGTKGVMLAPYFGKNFVNFYLNKQALHPDINVNRFYDSHFA